MKKLIYIAPLAVTMWLTAAQGDMTTQSIPKTTTPRKVVTAPDKMSEEIESDTTTKNAVPQDRFTSTEDHKLGPQVRLQIAEIVGALKANDIYLVIDEGDIKLLGKVPSIEARTKIGQAVQQIKGVKSVHNKLEVSKK